MMRNPILIITIERRLRYLFRMYHQKIIIDTSFYIGNVLFVKILPYFTCRKSDINERYRAFCVNNEDKIHLSTRL